MALASGRAETIEMLTSAIPDWVKVVRDPEALAAIRTLDVVTTPFVFEVREGRVAAKAALRDAEHLLEFITEAESVPTSRLRSHLVGEELSDGVA